MKKKTVVTVVAVTAALAVGPTAAAVATDGFSPPHDETQYGPTAPMNVVGYDAEVAEAHGYRIETDENGNQYSVPVTAEAIAEQARDEAAARDSVLPR